MLFDKNSSKFIPENNTEYWLVKEIEIVDKLCLKICGNNREMKNFHTKFFIRINIAILNKLGFIETDADPQDLVTPPKLAEYLIYLFFPRKDREAILGDLEEDFHEVHKKFGLRQARLQYWAQVFRSLWPIIRALIANIIVLSLKKLRATS
jgi:hypothetical protein